MHAGQIDMRFHGEVARRRARVWVELREALESAWELALELPPAVTCAPISIEEVMEDLSYGRD
ncbi:MAG: hypothetical protein WAU39_21200 [Polyangiales bacterium]